MPQPDGGSTPQPDGGDGGRSGLDSGATPGLAEQDAGDLRDGAAESGRANDGCDCRLGPRGAYHAGAGPYALALLGLWLRRRARVRSAR
jgi:hypothetical protein